MFKAVEESFVKIMKELVKKDVDFTMWSNDLDGNVGITVKADNGRKVDISEYMSPTGKMNDRGFYETIAIGLSIEYDDGQNCTYDEGTDVESFMDKICKFLKGEQK